MKKIFLKIKEKFKSLSKCQKVLLFIQLFLTIFYFGQMIEMLFFQEVTNIVLTSFTDYLSIILTYITLLVVIYKVLPLIIKVIKGVFSGKKENK